MTEFEKLVDMMWNILGPESWSLRSVLFRGAAWHSAFDVCPEEETEDLAFLADIASLRAFPPVPREEMQKLT